MRLSVPGVTTSTSEKHQGARIPEGKNTQSRSAIKRNDRPCGSIVEHGSEIQQFQMNVMNVTGVYPNDAMLRQISEGIKIPRPRCPTEMRCLVRTCRKSEKAWTFLMSLT